VVVVVLVVVVVVVVFVEEVGSLDGSKITDTRYK